MKSHARVVVIGGGIAGCSTLYHLTQLGWRDVVLLERKELTSGSTWHAAGNCPTFSGSLTIMKLQRYSVSLYDRLDKQSETGINYHRTGSVRLAHSEERMDEFRHVRGMARAQGIDYELLTPAQLKECYPFVELNDIKGALWDPEDGDIDPSQITQALAHSARAAGAEIYRFNPVEAISRTDAGEWRVHSQNGDITCEIIVNAAGYRVNEVARLVGVYHPVVSMQHQYLVTEAIPELAARGERLPLLRDPDVSYYLRQERDGLILGPYERDCRTWAEDGIPADFAMDLLPDDLDRLESYIGAAMERVPLLAKAGIQRVINGPIPYTPDGLPLIGPVYHLPNFYACAAFSFGIVQGGGAGKTMAEIIVHGQAEWDSWVVDPRRYTDYANHRYAVDKAVELYSREYDIGFPCEERPAGRPAKTSPLYPLLKAKRAMFGARGGWERAAWFVPADMPAVEQASFHHTNWFRTVGEECHAVRHRVGILDLPGFAKFRVHGPEAAGFLDHLICGRLPNTGRIALAYCCTERGGILSEFTITRLAEDDFYLCSAAAAEWHDHQYLSQHLPASGVALENLSARYGTLVIAGPHARDVLSHVTRADLSSQAFPWLSGRAIDIGFARVSALRVNYIGELGWELHIPNEFLTSVYSALMEAGAEYGIHNFGMYALDSLRLEKCYRAWKTDLSDEFTPWEAALDRFVRLDKGEFIGRKALLAQREQGIRQRLIPLLVDTAYTDAPFCASVWRNDKRVGLVTSGGYGHTLGKSIALAYVQTDLAVEGTPLDVEIFGERHSATVAREPLYDPDNNRLRA